jgi:FdhE protein
VSTVAWSSGTIWEKRIERARFKADDSPGAAELLSFYRQILEFQKAVYERLRFSSAVVIDDSRSLRESLDFQSAAASMPALLEVVKRWAPARLRELAVEFSNSSPEQVHNALRTASLAATAGDTPNEFFCRAALQPVAEWFARNNNNKMGKPTIAGNKCPSCEGEPQFAILRQEGDGGKRWLGCSFCLTEWEFQRILCPNCGELDNAKLPRFTDERNPAVRVEACDSCQAYLKSFDLTVDGLIVPLVDDIATAPLDIWAVEKGYWKLQPNLLGF